MSDAETRSDLGSRSYDLRRNKAVAAPKEIVEDAQDKREALKERETVKRVLDRKRSSCYAKFACHACVTACALLEMAMS